MQQGKSFAIATGYGEGAVPEQYSEVPRIEKPFDPQALLQIVRQLNRAQGKLNSKIRSLDNAKQPEDQDQDQQTAETDIHG
jgi:hypothetical protein